MTPPLGLLRARGRTADAASVAAAVGIAGCAGAGLAVAASYAGERGAIAAICALVGAGAAAHFGIRGVGIGLLTAAVATAALNNLRLLTSVTVSDALLAVSIAALVASAPRFGASFTYARPVLLAVVLIALGGLLASLASANPAASAFNVARLVIAAGGVVFGLVLWSPGRSGVFALAWLWVASAVATSLWGLLVHQDVAGRAIGLSTHSNHLALAATMALGPALGLAAGLRGWRRLLAVGLVAVLVAGVVASGSRASLVGSAVVAMAFAAGYPRAVLPMLAAVGGVMFLGVTGVLDIGGSNALGRLLGLDGLGAAASDAERWLLLDAALDRLGLAPLVGSGFESALEAHNVYLQVWAGAGLLGLSGLAMLAWIAVRRYLEARDSAPGTRDAMATLALGLACGWLGYFVVALFQNPLWDRYVWVPAALIAVTWPHFPRRGAR